MKAILLNRVAICASTILALSGCTSDFFEPAGESFDVELTALLPENTLPDRPESRAFGEAARKMQLSYAVYEQGSSTPVVTSLSETEFSNGSASVKFRLAKGKTYEFLFWADAAGSDFYTFDPASKTVTASYTTALANDDSRDAFFAAENVTITSGAVSVQLTRPFAQVNVATTDLAAAGIDPATAALSTSLEVNGLPNSLNLSTGEVSGSSDVTFALADAPVSEKFPVEVAECCYLSMNYLLVGDRRLHDMSMTVKNGDKELAVASLANIPVRRNYRTNISGNFLTDETTFNIVISPAFGGAEGDAENPNNDPSEPSYSIASDGSKIYSVETADELRWIGEKSADAGFWNDATFELAADIDLSDSKGNPTEWDPIDIPSTGRDITVNGNGHTVTGYTFAEDAEDNVGLFGTVDDALITDIKVSDVTYKGAAQRNVGALVGSTSGRLRNVEASGVEITVPSGGNVGAIAGTVSGLTSSSDDRLIESATVIDSKIHASEAAGVVAGKFDNRVVSRAIGNIFFIVNDQTVIGNTVTSSDGLRPGLLAGESTDKASAVFYAGVNQSGNSTDVLLGDGRIDQASILLNNQATLQGTMWLAYNADQLRDAFARVTGGQTISLLSDIDFRGLAIQPFEVRFMASETADELFYTVDFNGHTLSNFSITTANTPASLFVGKCMDGSTTAPIRGVTFRGIRVDNAEISCTGANYCSVLFNRFKGNISDIRLTNCKVGGSDIKNVGAISGSFVSGEVKDCVVENCKIEGDRYVGILFGSFSWAKAPSVTVDNCRITGSSAIATEQSSLDERGLAFGAVGSGAGTKPVLTLRNLTNEENNPSDYYLGSMYKGGYSVVVQ